MIESGSLCVDHGRDRVEGPVQIVVDGLCNICLLQWLLYLERLLLVKTHNRDGVLL